MISVLRTFAHPFCALALACSLALTGCGGWFSQMRSVERAVEGKNYPVASVGIAKADRQKTVTVNLKDKVNDQQRQEIVDTVKTVVPDANNVVVVDGNAPKANTAAGGRRNHK